MSDGTKIFLNAETKLIYPESFNSKTREVMLEGEAYFGVVERESQPFILKTENFDVKIYGTSFNVSAYPEDNFAHTTLVEGSVEVIGDKSNPVKIKPGQQARYYKSTKEINSREVETWLYTDWKNGQFLFDNESLDNILIGLSRWYDFKTEYQDTIAGNYHFSGTLNRYDELSKVLIMISLTTNISFEIKSGTVEIKAN